MTPLVGTVVLVSVFLGIGPAHVAIAAAWTGLLLYEEPRWSLTIDDTTVARRWAVSLIVALVLVWIAWTLQRLRHKEAARATQAEEASAAAKDLQELARALAAAATPTEVAQALVYHMPDLLGAAGGSLGLVDDGELVIIDPGAATRAALQPGLRLPLSTRAPIAAAARTGKPAYANTRGELERVYPDGARLVRYAASSLAVPLKVAGEVVGSTGFPFAHPHAVDEDMVALATVAAEAGGQALEQARLHELEQAQRLKAELAADRTRLLQDVAEHLTAAGTAAEVGEVIAGQAAGALAADAVLVYECDADRRLLRLLAHEASRTRSSKPNGSCRWKCRHRRRTSFIRTAAAVADASADSRALRRDSAASVRARRGVVVLLSAQDRDADARRCALRLSRADRARLGDSRHRRRDLPAGRRRARPESRLRGEERVTRRRTERLQALTAGLSGALTSGDVAAIFIQAVIDSIGADAAALSIVDDDTGQMHAVAWRASRTS